MYVGVNYICKKEIEEPWFSGLTLKTILNWDLYWHKCTLYIKNRNFIETLVYVEYIIFFKLPNAFSL
jgi:hypothetical protein